MKLNCRYLYLINNLSSYKIYLYLFGLLSLTCYVYWSNIQLYYNILCELEYNTMDVKLVKSLYYSMFYVGNQFE